jgi:N-acetylmuramoyl-L-alanine amidase
VHRLVARFILLSVFFVVLSGKAYTDVTGIRFGKTGNTTRVVLDMTEKVEPGVFLLADPNRIVVDLPANDWRANNGVKARGVIEGYRHGLFNQGTYRIVLDLSEPAIVKSSFHIPPRNGYSHRIVLDIEPASNSKFQAAVTSSRADRLKFAASKKPAPEVKAPAPRKSGKRLIVIDPGHGGVDPGTLGILGVNEKEIALKIAKKIKATLEATGRYSVHLTRTRDIYIPHRNRYDVAKRMNADLFISIHADSIGNPKVRGGTIYTLSEKASDREAARLARKENKSDIIAGLDLANTNSIVSDILIDLAQRETMNLSAQFAEALLPEMRRHVRMHKRGHRYANLLVLKSPDVPSILLETGYLTNKEDARLLNSREGQTKIANGVRYGLDRYFTQRAAVGR